MLKLIFLFKNIYKNHLYIKKSLYKFTILIFILLNIFCENNF